jgi:lipopolysaccharide export system protein LptA
MLKNRASILLIVISISIVPFLFSPLCNSESGNTTAIKIASDRLDAYDDKNLILFSGNVVVTRKDITMNSDRICLYYSKREGVKEDSSTGMMTSGEIDRIEAEGNVRVEREDRTVTGDSAIFYNGEQKIIIRGNAEMKEGENVVRGDIITFFLNENRGIVESSGNGRVRATIYSDEIN